MADPAPPTPSPGALAAIVAGLTRDAEDIKAGLRAFGESMGITAKAITAFHERLGKIETRVAALERRGGFRVVASTTGGPPDRPVATDGDQIAG